MTHRGRKPRLITAWGESKTLKEWVLDRRCKAPSVTALRQRRYAHPDEPWEELMRAPSGAQIGHMVTAWGQTKSIRGWARDDRCAVSGQALARRFRLFPDRPPEEVISAPPDVLLGDDSAYGAPVERHRALGESKTLREWAADPRCPVGYWGLIARMRAEPDASLEELITRPRRAHDSGHTAFGLTQSLAAWARDPRCAVGYDGLCARVREHPDAPFETALTASTAEWRAYTRYS